MPTKTPTPNLVPDGAHSNAQSLHTASPVSVQWTVMPTIKFTSTDMSKQSFSPSRSPTKINQIPSSSPLLAGEMQIMDIPTKVPTVFPVRPLNMSVSSGSSAPSKAGSEGQSELECNCAPTVFEWTLDFSQSCKKESILQGSNSGIDDALCSISGKDLIPVVVQSITIVELNKALNETIHRSFRPGVNLVNGDTFDFTSVSASDPAQAPGGLQMRLEGKSSDGVDIFNDWIVSYSNNCNAEVFVAGDSLGWTVFSKLLAPTPESCPLALRVPVPSQSPSVRRVV